MVVLKLDSSCHFNEFHCSVFELSTYMLLVTKSSHIKMSTLITKSFVYHSHHTSSCCSSAVPYFQKDTKIHEDSNRETRVLLDCSISHISTSSCGLADSWLSPVFPSLDSLSALLASYFDKTRSHHICSLIRQSQWLV